MKTFDAGFRRVLDAFAFGAVLILAGMIVLICADVASRNIFNRGIEASVELTEYALYLMTVLCVPWLLNRGQHIRIDFLVSMMPFRTAWAMEFLCDALGLVVMAMLVRYGIKITVASHAANSLVWKSLVFPEYWLLVPLPICAAVTGIEFALRIVRLWTGERKPGATTAALG
jgi:TRAP-type C4-dicarboxylate transport system permease small subunit